MMNLTYKPHIGKNYGKTKFGKLLILGDSHYFSNGIPDRIENFTIEKIRELSVLSARFFDKIAEVCDPMDQRDFWNKIAFANAIQTPFQNSDQKPSKGELDEAKLAFREYTEIIKPEKVIVFSSRVWEHCFNKQGWGTHLDKINNRWNIRELPYSSGICKALGVYHPSARDFQNHNFPTVVNDFLTNY